MTGRLLPKVTPQQMSYFHRKMCLKLFNHVTLKATENAKSDDDITLKKNHIFKTFCVGDIFKSILGKFINMVDIFGVYLCTWLLLNTSGYIVNNFI